MTQDAETDIETRLTADTSGNYKRWLLNVLKQHKDEFERLKGKMLPSEEYKQYDYMSRAIDAAIAIIESKKLGRDQDHAFNNIF